MLELRRRKRRAILIFHQTFLEYIYLYTKQKSGGGRNKRNAKTRKTSL